MPDPILQFLFMYKYWNFTNPLFFWVRDTLTQINIFKFIRPTVGTVSTVYVGNLGEKIKY